MRHDASSRAAPRVFAVGCVLALLLLTFPAGGWAAIFDAPCDCSAYGSAGLLLVRSAKLQTRGVLAISLGGNYHESFDLSSCLGSDDAGRYTSLHLAGNYGLFDWLELSFDVPARSIELPQGSDVSGNLTGLDSPVVGAKLALPSGSGTFSVALEGRVGVSLGDEIRLDGGCDEGISITGGSNPDWDVVLLATADLTDHLPLKLHANVGYALHREDERGRRFYPEYYPPISADGDATDNDAIILRGAVEFPGRTVSLFTEFRGDILMDKDLVALKENPLTVTPGVRVRFADGWAATVGLSVAISGDDQGTPDFDPHDAYPDWEATLALAYAWPIFAADTDDDGIPDYRDDCRRMPEDFDGYDDEDGCPDPDNDGDGIPDSYDGTPLIGEDFDGFEDDDGIPDLDNDGDGIVDDRDMCPDAPEDLDGFEDEDGCPDD